MKWTIRQLNQFRQDSMPVDGTADLSGVMKRDPEIRASGPVRVTGTCSVGTGQATWRFMLV